MTTIRIPARAQGAIAFLRAAHYLTGGPEVDIYVDGRLALPNLGYQDTTAYIQLEEGTHEVNFSAAGKNQPGGSPIVLQAAGGDLFTFVFSGNLADKVLDVYMTSETGLAKANNLTLASSTMPLLFVQGSKEAGSVDVYINEQLAGNVNNGASMLTLVPLMPYTLKVTAAGDASKVLIETAGVPLANVTGVIGLTGAADKLSLDVAYSTIVSAAEFLEAQTANAPLKFTTLLKAMEVAQLGQALSAAGTMTIFAPDDSAFARIDATMLDEALADPETTRAMVMYHIVPETVSYEDILSLLLSSGTKKTVQGAEMTFGFKTQIELGGTPVNLLSWNIHTSNAVIHVIDSVLMPPS
jgi:uncharacterized surface protein with fasciclin (FAS1) repeats